MSLKGLEAARDLAILPDRLGVASARNYSVSACGDHRGSLDPKVLGHSLGFARRAIRAPFTDRDRLPDPCSARGSARS